MSENDARRAARAIGRSRRSVPSKAPAASVRPSSASGKSWEGRTPDELAISSIDLTEYCGP